MLYDWLTLTEAAARLGLSRSTLAAQVRTGRLRTVLRGRMRWVEAAEVERYRRESKREKT